MRVYLISILFFSFLPIKSVEIDSSIYQNKYEKKIFNDYLNDISVNPLELFISYNYNDGLLDLVNGKIQSIKRILDQNNVTQKPIKKQIKEIYNTVHEQLLKKYDEKALFNDQFLNGSYNCVTASALYALILSDYNINFEIKETPTHVYLIADPGNTKVLIETTLPDKGIYFFDEKFKRDYISFLIKNKIISKAEYESKSIDILFNENYDKNTTVNEIQLAGLHYYNMGIFSLQNSKFQQAAYNLEKAHLLYPSNNIKYNYNVALANVLNNQLISKDFKGSDFAKFLNLNSKDSESLSWGETFFNSVSNEWVINHPNITKYTSFYEEFSHSLSDSIDIDIYSQTYYRILGYYYYTQQMFPQALAKLNFAYIANPENIETKQLIEGMAVDYIFTERNHEQMIDTMEYYFEIFPFLQDKDNFQNYYTYCYLRSIETYYSYDKEKEGKKLLERFEQLMASNTNIIVNTSFIEIAYSSIIGYYVQNQKYNLAINYAREGLHYVPKSLSLESQLESIQTYKKLVSSEQYVYIPKDTPEDFGKDFFKYFPGCWKIESIRNNGDEVPVSSDDIMEINASENKKVEFSYNGKKESGKWAVRTTSKLFYLIPERDKEDYSLFKVIRITDNELVLREYKNNKQTKKEITLKACN